MDERFRALEAWLSGVLGAPPERIERASTDASFRRYFRVFSGNTTRIAMDAPPERENSAAFVKVASLMKDAGLHVPDILAQDLSQGFLLLSDLGTRGYLAALRPDSLEKLPPERLLDDATTALVRWQAASRPGELPEYDEALLRRELDLFPDWYVARHLGATLTPAQREILERVFRAVLERNLAEARVFVHRDFMPRNLMVCEPNPGVLDFQDAVYGPVSYDVACLMRDAFISWDEERVLDVTVRYWEKARAARIPVPADFSDFWRDVEYMGLQRHLKVIGIFARLCHRDGKCAYLEDVPRFLGYVRHAAKRYRDLTPLLRVLDELEDREAHPRPAP
jgi:aminoglycoside/choline kinase family phosphotransferase